MSLMRLTNLLMTDISRRQIVESQDRMYVLNMKATTGKRYLRASENPSVVVDGLNTRTNLAAWGDYEATVDSSMAWMNAADLALSDMIDGLTRAQNNILQGMNDTSGEDERKTLATELNANLNEMIGIANQQQRDRYIFSGYRTQTKPFVADDDNWATTVSYAGDANNIRRDISPGVSIQVGINGQDIASSNVFSALISARDILNTLPFDRAGLQTALDSIKTASDAISTLMAANGARVKNMETTLARIADVNTELKAYLSEKEEVNAAEVVSHLKNAELVYQTVLSVTAKTNDLMTLFDYL